MIIIKLKCLPLRLLKVTPSRSKGSCCGLTLVINDHAEEVHKPDRRLVTNRDMKLGFCVYFVREELNFLHGGKDRLAGLHSVRRAGEASLYLRCIELGDAHANSVALACDLHWFPEHLHRLDLLLDLERRELDCLTNFDLSSEDRTSHHCSLPLDLEAVVNGKLEMLVPVLAVRYIDMNQYRFDEILDSKRLDGCWLLLFLLLCSACVFVSACLLCCRCDGHYWEVCAELGVLESGAQLFHLLLEGGVSNAIWEQVNFVHCYN